MVKVPTAQRLARSRTVLTATVIEHDYLTRDEINVVLPATI